MRINVVIIFIIGLVTFICAEKSDNEVIKNREKRTVGLILGSLIKGLILKDAILQFLVNATTPTSPPPRPASRPPRPSKRPRPPGPPSQPPPAPPAPKPTKPPKPTQPPKAQQPPQKRPKPAPSQTKPSSPSKAPSSRPPKSRPPPPPKAPTPPPPPPPPTTKKPRNGKPMVAKTNARPLTPPPPPPPPTNPPDSSEEIDMISTENPDFANQDDQISTTEIQGLNANTETDDTTLDYDMGGQPNSNYISSNFYADEDGPSKIGLNQFFPQNNPSPAQSYVKTNAYEFTNYHGHDQIKIGSQQADASALRHYFDPSYEIHNVNLDYDHYYYKK